jgi:hypothetical protein
MNDLCHESTSQTERELEAPAQPPDFVPGGLAVLLAAADQELTRTLSRDPVRYLEKMQQRDGE